MGRAPGTVIAFCCAFRAEYALHVGYNRKGFFEFTRTLQSKANQITPEAIMPNQSLNLLSGGQTRALMIADIACICDSPIVLIDEIENAGIDKEKAFALLLSKEKLVMIVTHDPHTAFMAKQRIVMEAGAIKQVIQRSKTEEETFHQLSKEYRKQKNLQDAIRNGACV